MPSLASRVLSGGASLLLSQVGTILLAFAAQRIILSTLTKEENGELFVVRRIADLLVVILCDAGLNGVAMRKLARMPERAAEIVASVATFRMVMWGVATCLAVGYAFVAGYHVLDVGIWCFYMLISARAGLLRYTIEIPYRMRVRFGLVSALSILDGALFFLFIWWMRDALSASNIIIAFTLAALPSFILLAVVDRGRHIWPARASWVMTREMLVDAMPVMVAVVLLHVHDKIDAMMLEWFSTAREVGVFSAAYQSLAPLTGTIPIAAAMAIVPAIARLSTEDPEQCRRFALTGLRLLVASAIGVATLSSIATPWIIEIVSKGRYADNEGQFFTFLWMTVPIFILFYVQEVNIALGEQRKNIGITAVLAVTTIVAGTLLIPSYASYGAIVAKFLAVGAGAVVAYVTFHRVLSQSLTLRLTVGLVIATLTCSTAAYALPTVMPRLAAMTVGLGIWLIAVFIVGLVRPSDIRLIVTMARGRSVLN